MTLSSIEYFLFLPSVFLLFWLVFGKTKTIQNIFIVASSLLFYGFWDWRFLGLLLLTALSTFYSGLCFERVGDNNKKRKLVLWVTLIINLGILFFFKYYNFFIQAFADSITLLGGHASVSTLRIILPVGISFYTFAALSYTIDVYQRKVEPTKDVLAYLAYATFFPSILSGPISRAQKQLPQFFTKRQFDYNKAVEGCKFLLLGAIMKMCLADRIGVYVDQVYSNYLSYSGNTLFFTSICYTIQIYADFAGYSLMAIGSGKLLGIELPTNFIRPYFAKTVTDFWRRWHISLTTWFRDYIYFPLGGNRCSKARWMVNTMVVFVVSGLWHGANYTFLIWGAMHGLFMIGERLIYGDRIKSIPTGLSLINIVRVLITFSIVNFAWIFFRLDSLGDVVNVINKIVIDRGGLYFDINVMVYVIPSLLLVFLFDRYAERNQDRLLLMDSKNSVVRWVSYVVFILFLVILGSFEQTQFIYFQF
jgi:D-alanyl-lipoteichoic acid acyltransferase DltB (MBOAT superfamily)